MHRTRLRNEFLAASILGLLSLTFLVWSFSYTSVSGDFPKLIGWATLALAMLDMVKSFLRMRSTEEPEHADKPSGVTFLDHVKVILWPVALVLGMHVLGFLTASFVFIVGYMLLWGRNGVLRSLITAAVTTLLIYLAFDLALGAHLPQGIIFS